MQAWPGATVCFMVARPGRVVKYVHGPSVQVGEHDKIEYWYVHNINKHGNATRGLVEHTAWYTPLFTCGGCGKISTPKNVRYRSDANYWPSGQGWIEKSKEINGRYFEGQDILCTGCWNKRRSFVKKLYEADVITRLINKLKKEISHERKNQNHRTDARVFGNDDGWREERRP